MENEVRLLKIQIKRLRKILNEQPPSLEIMLKCRGFKIYKKEPLNDLLVHDKKFADVFYNKLKKYSFRLFLRDVIKHQHYFTPETVARFATKEVTSRYIDFLLRNKIAEKFGNAYRLRKRPIKSFGQTLEWFVAMLMKKEFQAETARGVKFKRPEVGGDYDLIAKVDSSIIYMEIKSSPPKQIYDMEIKAFMNRVEDLSPEISVFFVDTELRMKDKIVLMFEDELKKRYKKPPPVERIKKELFHINKKIFIINSKPDIAMNIQSILSFKWRHK